MATIEIIKGDFENSHWNYEKGKIKKGWYNIKEIPICDLTSIVKGEVVKNLHYVNFETGTGQSFIATMNEKTYSKIYDEFVRVGNNPVNDTLPIQKKSKSNVFWSVLGVLFILGMINGEDSNSTASSSARSSNAEIDAQVFCKMALEDVAKYGAKFPRSANKLVFPYEDGRYLVTMDAEIQNGFGAWGKSRFSCIVNGTKVTQLVVDGKTIY